jgi:hypothetical protein
MAWGSVIGVGAGGQGGLGALWRASPCRRHGPVVFVPLLMRVVTCPILLLPWLVHKTASPPLKLPFLCGVRGFFLMEQEIWCTRVGYV